MDDDQQLDQTNENINYLRGQWEQDTKALHSKLNTCIGLLVVVLVFVILT